MQLTGNTIFITGGGSGIGRGLAQALYGLGNTVIISGRRRAMLDETTLANPKMASVELNVEDPASIAEVAAKLVKDYPALNVLMNNAGIMRVDNVSGELSDEDALATVTTNLLGPMRLTSALIGHLKGQTSATVINVTSGLAFTPLAMTAVYCATKAAIHSYTMSLRFKLRGTGVKVLELAPPYVQTDLLHGKNDPTAMPLADYIREAMAALGTDADEVLVERMMMLRNNAGPNEAAFVNQFNEMMEKQRG